MRDRAAAGLAESPLQKLVVDPRQLFLNPVVRLMFVVACAVSPIELEVVTLSNNFCSAPLIVNGRHTLADHNARCRSPVIMLLAD